MKYTDTDILWYVLFAANGKAMRIKSALEAASIEYFSPLYYKDVKVEKSDRYERVALPLVVNLIFARSSKNILDTVLKDAKRKLAISSDLYYRDYGDKRAIVISENQMRNFIAVAKKAKERMIYLSNDEVNVRKGVKAKITGGEFAGAEGLFMRIKGNKRLVVSISNLFSVATEYIPSCYVQTIE
jgi:transcription antitermination factor NusG